MLFDSLLEQKNRPVVELGLMPDILAKESSYVFWWKMNKSMPKKIDDWRLLIEQLIRHLTDRYGRDEICEWYFEVWNEPNHPGFFAEYDNMEAYMQLYRAAAETIKAEDSRYRVGGPENPGQYIIQNPAGRYRVILLLAAPFPEKIKEEILKIQNRPFYTEEIEMMEDGSIGRICMDSVNVEQNGDLRVVFQTEEILLCAVVIEGITDSNQLQGTKFYRIINCGTSDDLSHYEGDFRCAECGDFYEDWAASQFGHKAGDKAAAIFRQVDSRVPRPSYWENGPGKLMKNQEKWENVKKNYQFVEEFEALEDLVPEGECKERYDYWLQQWRYLRASAKVGCLLETFENVCVIENNQIVFDTAEKITEQLRKWNGHCFCR